MIAVAVVLAIAAPIRLADLIREAREKNPDLKAAEARVRATTGAAASDARTIAEMTRRSTERV